MRVSILVFIGVLVVISVASCLGQKLGLQPKLKGWGTYIDGTNKFSINTPPGWSVATSDRQWMKNNEEAVSFASPDLVGSFDISIYPNPQHLSAKQWFDKDVKEAGKSWGAKWSIIAEHPITVNGQKGYATLMQVPDGRNKYVYFTWGGRAYMIYYSKWWTSMSPYEIQHYKSCYATQELMLKTFKSVE